MKSIATLSVIVLLVSSSHADERILSFHSDVRVLTDGMIEVTETIQVQAEGKQIRRGIYRDFPVEYERSTWATATRSRSRRCRCSATT